jgi:hypothetical protein
VIEAGPNVPPELDLPRWSARIFLREDAGPEG